MIYLDGGYFEGDQETPIDETKLPEGSFENATDIYYEADISDKGNYTPTRDGYVFVGWYSDDTCTQKYSFDKMPAHNVTVYAKWVQESYNIVLHNNADGDPTFEYKSESQSENFYIGHNEKVGDVGGTRDDYELIGWYTDAAFKHAYDFDAFVMNDSIISKYGKPDYRESDWPGVHGQLNLYARWRHKLKGGNGIHVEYDANGGSGAPTDTYTYTDQA